MSPEIARQPHGHPWRRTGLTGQDARDVFDRARRRASFAKLAGWLRGRPSSGNRVPVLGEVPAATGASGAVPGVRRLEFERAGRPGPASQMMVPIDQIVGTAESTTCFDRRFRPTSEAPRARFEGLAAAVLSGRGMDRSSSTTAVAVITCSTVVIASPSLVGSASGQSARTSPRSA